MEIEKVLEKFATLQNKKADKKTKKLPHGSPSALHDDNISMAHSDAQPQVHYNDNQSDSNMSRKISCNSDSAESDKQSVA